MILIIIELISHIYSTKNFEFYIWLQIISAKFLIKNCGNLRTTNNYKKINIYISKEMGFYGIYYVSLYEQASK